MKAVPPALAAQAHVGPHRWEPPHLDVCCAAACCTAAAPPHLLQCRRCRRRRVDECCCLLLDAARQQLPCCSPQCSQHAEARVGSMGKPQRDTSLGRSAEPLVGCARASSDQSACGRSTMLVCARSLPSSESKRSTAAAARNAETHLTHLTRIAFTGIAGIASSSLGFSPVQRACVPRPTRLLPLVSAPAGSPDNPQYR